MRESGPAVMKKATSKASMTARARCLCARVGGKLERTKCSSSRSTAAVLTIGASLRRAILPLEPGGDNEQAGRGLTPPRQTASSPRGANPHGARREPPAFRIHTAQLLHPRIAPSLPHLEHALVGRTEERVLLHQASNDYH